MFELGALLSLRRAVPHLGSQIKEAETIFQYNLCPREFAQFYVTRLDYWIVRICSPSWKWCGPEITDRKENGSWVYLPMWQGNNMVHILFCSYFLSFSFFFSFQSCTPGLLYEFLIFVSHWEILKSCDMPAENIRRSQKAQLWKHVLLVPWSNPITALAAVCLP